MPSPTVGAVPPPPGVTPNFQHPPDAGRTTILGGSTVCVTVVFVAFLLRCCAKYSIRQKYTIEDWPCAIAWWLYIQSLLYGPTVFSTKVTLLFLTSRVCSVRRTISKSIHLFIYFLVICYIPLQIVKTIVCLPIEAYWDPEVRNDTAKDVKCLNQGAIFLVDSGVAVVTDATIVVLPIVLVWSMRLPLCKKVRAAGILGAGGVAVAVTAYRLPLLFKFERSMDVTAGFVIIGLVCPLEQAIGFVCACLPLLNLFKSRRMTPGGPGCWRMSPAPSTTEVSPLMATVSSRNHRQALLANLWEIQQLTARIGVQLAAEQDPKVSPQGTRDTTYDTAWDREANSPGEQREGWLATSRGSTTRGHEQSSDDRTVRIANDEPTSSSPLPKPQPVIIRDRIWDGDRT
ncbi:hypothetical protein PG997_011350 [Apiospora hydei]|uniref:Rhodopsin domain-containing protein n=1 Tax=Apiospora hydei TaxID=1337664 RepID=A0ABR1VIT4_9PEZI